MEKNRLEAFSDGVFAIAITLLVLDIRIPIGTTATNLGSNLRHIVPSVATYVLSFVLVGLYWIFHHYSAAFCKKIDARVIAFNMLHLMFIVLLPFTTSLLSEFYLARWALVIYGINLMLINLAASLVMNYLYKHPKLSTEDFTERIYKAQNRQTTKINILYIAGIIFVFITPQVSIYIYGVIVVYLVISTLFPQRFGRRNRVIEE